MNPLAVTKSRLRLSAAKAALDDLETCNEYGRFAELWYSFLVAAKSVYTVLEQGAKASPQARQWFGGVATKRRGDPLLQYLFQARDDDEHGLNPVIKQDKTVAGAWIGVPGFGIKLVVSAVYDTEPSEDASIELTAIDGIPFTEEQKFPYVRLIRVHGRDKKPYDPPNQHLGTLVDTDTPVPVGRLAIFYLETIVEEAAALT